MTTSEGIREYSYQRQDCHGTNVFDAAFPAITAFFNTMGFEYYDNIIANDMDRFKGIHGHPTALMEAHAKGKEVVGVIERMDGG